MKHHFTMNLNWPGGRNNVGTIEAKNLKTHVSIPKEMNGPEIGTNPDEMLLGASATCYMISLGAMLERANVEATLEIKSVGIVDVTNGVFTYEEIHHHVNIHLQQNTDENKRVAERLAHKAEGTCMISKALKGNVNIFVTIDFT
jgi:peroxiredoxin-like protein